MGGELGLRDTVVLPPPPSTSKVPPFPGQEIQGGPLPLTGWLKSYYVLGNGTYLAFVLACRNLVHELTELRIFAVDVF